MLAARGEPRLFPLGMPANYPILDVSRWTQESPEPQGQKKKVWLVDPDSNELWLFRYPRQVGEAWAEKIAEQVAEKLRLHHAVYKLAIYQGTTGAMTRDFTARRTSGGPDLSRWPLIHGNVVLQAFFPNYQRNAVRSKSHTLARILSALRTNLFSPPPTPDLPECQSAAQAFLGYLMFDVLIGNTDRHHENWGVQVGQVHPQPLLRLAPTFDHASSLGRNLSDEQRERCLCDGRMDQFCSHGRSRIFDSFQRRIRVRDLFLEASRTMRVAARAWLRHLASVPLCDLLGTIDPVPDLLMGPTAKRFCRSMLESNRRFLLSLNLA